MRVLQSGSDLLEREVPMSSGWADSLIPLPSPSQRKQAAGGRVIRPVVVKLLDTEVAVLKGGLEFMKWLHQVTFDPKPYVHLLWYGPLIASPPVQSCSQ